MFDPHILIRQLVSVLLCVTLAACSLPSEQRTTEMPVPEASQFELGVTIDGHSYSQGTPITVTTTLAVHDEGEAHVVFYNNPMMDCTFALTDEEGQTVPLTKIGRIAKSALVRRILSTMDHSHPVGDSFQLDTYYDLSKPGMYTLTLTTNPTTEFEVPGNTVTFSRLP